MLFRSDEIRELVTKGGGDFLFNTSKTLRLGTWNLTVVGLGDLWAGDLQPSIAFPSSSSADTTTLVLSHNPDTKEQLKPYSWDLMLCGHTHGGQVRLPFIGAPILPVKDKRFVEGLYQWDARWIHITRGVGNLYGVRFNCRPEINLLTLT